MGAENALVGPVADPTAAPGWSSEMLREVNPYYWATKFGDNGNWPTYEVHAS